MKKILIVLAIAASSCEQKDYGYLNTDRRGCSFVYLVSERYDTAWKLRSVIKREMPSEFCGDDLKTVLADSMTISWVNCPPPDPTDTLFRIERRYFQKK